MIGSAKNCPFYGHSFYHSNSKLVSPPFLLLDSRGNQCAIVVHAHAPCKLEMESRVVDWRECPIAKELYPGVD